MPQGNSHRERIRIPLTKSLNSAKQKNDIGNAFIKTFVAKFRANAASAMEELSRIEEPLRSDILRVLTEHSEDLDEFPRLCFKLDHFLGFDLGSADKFLRNDLLHGIAKSDPDGVAAAILEEGSVLESQLLIDSLIIDSKGSNLHSGDTPTAVASALVTRLMQVDDDKVPSAARAQKFRSALTLLDADAIEVLSTDFATGDGWFADVNDHGKALLGVLAERLPDKAIRMAESADPGSSGRASLLEALAAQGYDPIKLNSLVAGSSEAADSISYSKGKLAYALQTKESPAAFVAELEFLESVKSENAELKGEVFRMIDGSLDHAGDFSAMFQGLFNSDAQLAVDATNLIVRKLAKSDPISLSEFLTEHLDSPKITDQILMPFIDQIHNDPEAVVMWAAQLEDDEVRNKVVDSALDGLSAEESSRLRTLLSE